MAIISYREFTIRTEEHCDKNTTEKISKRYPIQVRDQGGYHYCYADCIENAETVVDSWWMWEAPKKQA